jgi:hypothetical protein
VTAAPRTEAARFASFWSTGTGWGTFTRASGQLTLSVLFGKLPCRSVEFAAAEGSAATSAKLGPKALAHKAERSGGRVVVTLDEAVELAEGDKLVLSA